MGMRWISVMLVLAGGVASADTVKGQLRFQPAGMCGGAMRPADYEPPPLAPAPGEKLTFVAGRTYSAKKPAATVTTGDDGAFKLDLKKGAYCVVRGDRGSRPTKKSIGQYYDLKCKVADWEKCDAVVVVPAKGPLAIDLHGRCEWAVCKTGGPTPP